MILQFCDKSYEKVLLTVWPPLTGGRGGGGGQISTLMHVMRGEGGGANIHLDVLTCRFWAGGKCPGGCVRLP